MYRTLAVRSMRSSFLRSLASCSSRRTSAPFVRGTSTQRDRIVRSIRSTLFLGFHRPRRYLWRPLLGSPALGALVFIGLGLFDEKDITLKGLEIARAADAVFAEFYTSSLLGTTVDTLRLMIGKPIRVLSRKDLEQGSEVIEAAREGIAALLVPGDPMAATTHVELRLRAHEAGIRTRIVHGPSIVSAAAGLLGLQSYKFGLATTIVFPGELHFMEEEALIKIAGAPKDL